MSILMTSYLDRIWPGVLVIALLLGMLRGRAFTWMRVAIYVISFMMLRDALFTSRLWQITGWPMPWMRFARDQVSLGLMGAASGLIVLALWRSERELSRGITWTRKKPVSAIGLGLAGGLAIAGPALVAGAFVSPWLRGGVVPYAFWPALAWLSFLGNLLEEL